MKTIKTFWCDILDGYVVCVYKLLVEIRGDRDKVTKKEAEVYT